MKLNKLLLSATAAAGFMAATSVAANADQVTVKAGDTVSAIANQYNTTVKQIEKDNNLSNVNMIYVGDVLEVNGTSEQTDNQATQAAPVATTNTTSSASAQASYYQAPAQTTQVKTYQAPVQTAQVKTYQAPAQTAQTNNYQATSASTSEDAAKAYIAGKESGGSYTASNGNYYGKYQLSKSYLNGDYSAANQERVANNYVLSRYGSWANAKAHWDAKGWY